jgi:two-component system response regulator BaeR
MPYILIVEDDMEIAENVILFLQAHEFETQHLTSGEHVISSVRQKEPDLILLDLMLPVVDGMTCCKKIRGFSEVPIIMMTAKVEEINRLVGLEAGADDYVCKPFSAAELVLRIKAILRRTQFRKPQVGFTLNKDTFEILYNQKTIELTNVEFALFALLCNRPGKIFSRNQILDLAYPDMRDISDRTIDSHVKNIRKKIKNIGVNGIVLDSVYGAGYRYITPA